MADKISQTRTFNKRMLTSAEVLEEAVENRGALLQMNRFRALDRSAFSDLWRNTLAQIPTVFGRLVYLSSVRNLNSGRYEHHGLALVFGEEEANKALKKSHAQSFSEWLEFDLEQQKADLDLYLSALPEDKKTVLEAWVRMAPYKNLLPTSVRPPERKLYLADLNAILEVFRNEYAVSGPDPDA